MFKFSSFSIFFILFGAALSSEPVLALPSDLNSAAVFLNSDTNAESPVVTPETFMDAITGMEFVLIRGGCFQMGSPVSEEGRGDDEGPRHEVCLDDFWLGRYEVTNSQFRLYYADHDSGNFLGHDLNGEMQPVVYVNWKAASDYAVWLSSQTARTFRLPTEAEWEYAARGMTTSARFWGEDQVDVCGYANVGDQSAKQNRIGQKFHNCTDGAPVSVAVGSFKPNAYGLYDILGNVWEWTGDWYDDAYNKQQKVITLQDSSPKEYRALRGGSWFSDPRNIRAARRSWFRPDSHNNSLGFRLIYPVK